MINFQNIRGERIWKRYINDIFTILDRNYDTSVTMDAESLLIPLACTKNLLILTDTEPMTHTSSVSTTNKEITLNFKSTAVLPKIKGVPEVLRRCLKQQCVRTVF